MTTTSPTVDPGEQRLRHPTTFTLPQNRGWIGFDLDGTLAFHEGWTGPGSIGPPIPRMVARLKAHIAEGELVRIFTARCFPLMYVPVSYSPDWTPFNYEQQIAKEAVEGIRAWCFKHLGMYLEITCVKDYKMWRLYDDRAVQVISNTGVCVEQLADMNVIAKLKHEVTSHESQDKEEVIGGDEKELEGTRRKEVSHSQE